MLFCDNGSELTSQVMDLWACHNQVKIDFSRPGKPTDNAYVESFNASRCEYNVSRPHRALGERANARLTNLQGRSRLAAICPA